MHPCHRSTNGAAAHAGEIDVSTVKGSSGVRRYALEAPSPHVCCFPQPTDVLGFSAALGSVCAALSSGAAITRESNLLRGVIRHADERVEVRLTGTDLSVHSSSVALGNRILAKLNEAGCAWRHDDAIVLERANVRPCKG